MWAFAASLALTFMLIDPLHAYIPIHTHIHTHTHKVHTCVNKHAYIPIPSASHTHPLALGAVLDAPGAVDGPQKLLAQAKALAEAGLIASEDILAQDFVFVEDVGVKDREDYLEQIPVVLSKLKKAMPDFELQAHAFQVDPFRADTVYFIVAPTGKHTGMFEEGGEVYGASNLRISFPPQMIACTWNSAGKCVRLTSGAVIDPSVGNTGGLTGVQGFLYAIGVKPSRFSYQPATQVIGDFFRRTPPTPKYLAARVSPFPDAVMFSLAKQVLASVQGTPEPGLLSDDFTFSSPFGVLNKQDFIKLFSSLGISTAFPDFNARLHNFIVDPFDQSRVWVLSRVTATHKGTFKWAGVTVPPTSKTINSAPEVMSYSFNEKGQCYKLTLGYSVDPLEGNTNGLAGPFGWLHAIGRPAPSFASRPLPNVIARFQSAATTPIITATKALRKALLDADPTPRLEQLKSDIIQAWSSVKIPSVTTAKNLTAPAISSKAPSTASKPQSSFGLSSLSDKTPKVAVKATPKASVPVSPSKPPTKPQSVSSAAKPSTPSIPKPAAPSTFSFSSLFPSYSSPSSPATTPLTKTPLKSPSKPITSTTPAKPVSPTKFSKSTPISPVPKITQAPPTTPARPQSSTVSKSFSSPSSGSSISKTPAKTPVASTKPVTEKTSPSFLASLFDSTSQSKVQPPSVPPKPAVTSAKPVIAKPSSPFASVRSDVSAPKPKPSAPAPSPAKTSAGAASGFAFSQSVRQKVLAAARGNEQITKKVEARVGQYVSGSITASDLLSTIRAELRGDVYNDVTRDIIGAIPAGPRRRELNQKFQVL